MYDNVELREGIIGVGPASEEGVLVGLAAPPGSAAAAHYRLQPTALAGRDRGGAPRCGGSPGTVSDGGGKDLPTVVHTLEN